MDKIPYADSNGSLSVKVELETAANVFLVDSDNYRKFTSGQDYKYYGGHYTKTPVTISVNGTGRWHLIVKGSRHYKYSFY